MPKDIKNTIQQLLQQPKYGNGIGLHRVKFLIERLRRTEWWQRLSSINVVGTDGKGSTTAMISAIFHQLNISHGSYTSPHLFDFNERIRVNEQPIPNEDLKRIARRIFKIQKAYETKYPNDTFGAFELFTSIGLEYFYQKKVEAVVLEAGIGGRFDSTRLCTGSLAALTSVSLEHTEILGKTVEEIAYDKMDILNTGGTLIVGDLDKKLLEKIRNYGIVKGIEIMPIKEHCIVHKVEYADDKMTLNVGIQEIVFKDLECQLVGTHQVSNLQVAVLLVKKWLETHRPQLPKADFQYAVKRALVQLNWKGRFQKIHSEPNIYIDAGHTPDALRQLVATVQKIKDKPLVIIVGFSKKRRIEAMLHTLRPIAGRLICTQAYHRGMATEVVYQMASELKIGLGIEKASTIEEAILMAKKMATDENTDVLVVGGLFLAVEVAAFLEGRVPKDLSFF